MLDFAFSTLQALGVQRKDVRLEMEFHDKESTIQCVVTFLKKVSIHIGNKKLEFEKYQKIRIGKSEKINEIKMAKIFDSLNFRVCNLSTSHDDKYMQVCIANKNYF